MTSFDTLAHPVRKEYICPVSLSVLQLRWLPDPSLPQLIEPEIEPGASCRQRKASVLASEIGALVSLAAFGGLEHVLQGEFLSRPAQERAW